MSRHLLYDVERMLLRVSILDMTEPDCRAQLQSCSKCDVQVNIFTLAYAFSKKSR